MVKELQKRDARREGESIKDICREMKTGTPNFHFVLTQCASFAFFWCLVVLEKILRREIKSFFVLEKIFEDMTFINSNRDLRISFNLVLPHQNWHT